jgi:hypothetical protein
MDRVRGSRAEDHENQGERDRKPHSGAF